MKQEENSKLSKVTSTKSKGKFSQTNESKLRKLNISTHSRIRMFSPETQYNRKDVLSVKNESRFRSNPRTPGSSSGTHKYYMNKRQHRSKRSHAMNESKGLPSVDNTENIRSQESNFLNDNYIADMKKVKIRFQGKPGQEKWGNLYSDFDINSDSKISQSKISMKDAERHAKILLKIEKFKEDKIMQELKMIEEEKAKTAKLLKLKKEKVILFYALSFLI